MGEHKIPEKLEGRPPTLEEECPDCGGTIRVWTEHYEDHEHVPHGVARTVMVQHIPPEEENRYHE